MIIDSQKKSRNNMLLVGLAVLFLVAVVALLFVIKKSNDYETVTPGQSRKLTPQQKQENMIEDLQKANEGMPELSSEEQKERQEGMIKAINEANSTAPSEIGGSAPTAVPSSNQDEKVQEMMDAINTANQQ